MDTENRKEKLLEVIRELEHVVFCARNRGYLSNDIELVVGAGKSLWKAHEALKMHHFRDSSRRVYDIQPTSYS